MHTPGANTYPQGSSYTRLSLSLTARSKVAKAVCAPLPDTTPWMWVGKRCQCQQRVAALISEQWRECRDL